MPSRVDLKIQQTIDRQLQNQPRSVIFCRRCVLSNQRPRLVIDEEGICSACRYAERKEKSIDWSARYRELGSCATAIAVPTVASIAWCRAAAERTAPRSPTS